MNSILIQPTPPEPTPTPDNSYYEDKKEQAERIRIDHFMEVSALTGNDKYYEDKGELTMDVRDKIEGHSGILEFDNLTTI